MGISEDLNKLFYKDGFGASSKAYFIKKVKDTYPSISTKEINSWLKDQEVTQVNKKPTQNLDLKITAKPRTFQIDIMYYRTGENLKPFLLLVDIMSRKAFCYVLPTGKKEARAERTLQVYKQFLKEVGHVEAIEGDNEFNNKLFKAINEQHDIRLDTSVSNENHISGGNKLGIIDRLVRTLKGLINKYRDIVDDRGTLQQMINKVLNTYNDSPNRGIQNRTPNEVFGDIKEQKERNLKESLINDYIFEKKVDLTPGQSVRVLQQKGMFDKEEGRFSRESYELGERIGYSFKVKDQKRIFKPNEIQPNDVVENVINRKRIAKDNAVNKKVKTIGKLVRNDDMTVSESKKAVKDLTDNSLGPSMSTRSKARQTRSNTKL